MRNLLNFIVRYYFFFLFLLLETVAILLVIQNQYYQRAFFASSANFVAGHLFSASSNLTDYFNLAKVNRQLSEENARLLELSEHSFLRANGDTSLINDSTFIKRFEFITAEIINNSVNRRDNHLTLNKGRKHGIEPDMGVITYNGVVGIVANVSNNFSSVVSLLHKDMQISAKLKKNDHIGSLIWEGYNYRYASLIYIPPHVELAQGDTVVTSGFSVIFPPDIFIGVIEDFEIKRGDNFYTARIKLALDFNNLKHVMVVNDLMNEEIRELQSQTPTVNR